MNMLQLIECEVLTEHGELLIVEDVALAPQLEQLVEGLLLLIRIHLKLLCC